MKIYIAGPDVFEKNAVEIGRKYKALCEKYGHTGLFPLDNECSSSKEICQANIALINESDVIIANGNEFRGEMDTGTAFEIGYAAAKNKKIIVYMDDTSSLVEKYGREDEKGRNVEDFGLPLNLMISESATIVKGNFEDALITLKNCIS